MSHPWGPDPLNVAFKGLEGGTGTGELTTIHAYDMFLW